MDKAINPFGNQANNSGHMSVASHAEQQRAIAEVQAAMMIAQSRPRNQMLAMDKILNACTRPSLAETALYQFGKGGSEVTGPSIRLAEAIAQQWGNMQFGFRELQRGIDARGVTFSEVEAFAWDMETNTRKPLQFHVPHWRDTKSGGYKITQERDIYELIASQAQRRVRACILSVIPGDVVEEATRQCEITLKSKADVTEEGIKKMLSTFEGLGVSKQQIEKRIQRRVDSIQPAQVVALKKIYASLRDGMSVVTDWFDAEEQGTAKELPAYDDDKFAKDLQGWANLVSSGKKTPDQVIAMLSSKNMLSDTQKAQIIELEEFFPKAVEPQQ